MKTLIHHTRLVSPGIDVPGGAVLWEDGKILGIFTAEEQLPPSDQTIDGTGKITAPGFFDIHTHGCAGADFCDATPEALRKIAAHRLTQGVTSFLGTTLTLPEDQLQAALENARNYMLNQPEGARIPGIHLEGPFIAADCAGAQNPAYLQKPDMGLVERMDRIWPVLKVSYSLELDPGQRFAAELSRRGIMPAAAHTAASFEEFELARLHGLRHLSHFCNVMTPLHHLKFGIVGGGLLRDDIYVELICDGVHLCNEMIQLIFRVKGCDRIMLITDSMMAAGMPDGDYELGGLPVVVKGGCARLHSGPVAGSTLCYHEGLKRVRLLTGLPLSELIRTTSWNQAVSLGITDLGKIEPGFRADLVMLDEDSLVPMRTIVGGVTRFVK